MIFNHRVTPKPANGYQRAIHINMVAIITTLNRLQTGLKIISHRMLSRNQKRRHGLLMLPTKITFQVVGGFTSWFPSLRFSIYPRCLTTFHVD